LQFDSPKQNGKTNSKDRILVYNDPMLDIVKITRG
jgi:hypothetical protein